MRRIQFELCRGKACLCIFADHLHGHLAADQRLGFRYIDSTIPLLHKSVISSLYSCHCLYRSICFEPGWKPRRQFGSWRGSFGSAAKAAAIKHAVSGIYNMVISVKIKFSFIYPIVSDSLNDYFDQDL